jgi:uncharacterized protein
MGLISMRKRFIPLIVFLLIFTNFALPALAFVKTELPVKPDSNIYVQDFADILSPETEQAILQLGSELDSKTTAQLVVVTVDSLDETPIDNYANELFRSWGIGDKEKNNGVLFLVAPNERLSRIEVGYGLEGALPDGKTGRIQDEYVLPKFKAGDFDGGILNGYAVLAEVIADEYNVQLSGKAEAMPIGETSPEVPLWVIFIILAVIILFILSLLIFFGKHGGGKGGGGFGTGGFGGGSFGGGFGGGSFGGGFGGGSSGGGGSSRSW